MILCAILCSFEATVSWYGWDFHGRETANSEIYDCTHLTCANRTLPFDTWIFMYTDSSCVLLRVNDRGPYPWLITDHYPDDLDFDLSLAGFKMLGGAWRGHLKIKYYIIPPMEGMLIWGCLDLILLHLLERGIL